MHLEMNNASGGQPAYDDFYATYGATNIEETDQTFSSVYENFEASQYLTLSQNANENTNILTTLPAETHQISTQNTTVSEFLAQIPTPTSNETFAQARATIEQTYGQQLQNPTPEIMETCRARNLSICVHCSKVWAKRYKNCRACHRALLKTTENRVETVEPPPPLLQETEIPTVEQIKMTVEKISLLNISTITHIPKQLRAQYTSLLNETLHEVNQNPQDPFLLAKLLLMPKLILGMEPHEYNSRNKKTAGSHKSVIRKYLSIWKSGRLHWWYLLAVPSLCPTINPPSHQSPSHQPTTPSSVPPGLTSLQCASSVLPLPPPPQPNQKLKQRPQHLA